MKGNAKVIETLNSLLADELRGGRVLLDSQVKFLSDDLLVRLPVLVFLV